MLDKVLSPDQPISALTVADLQSLINSTVRQALREEIRTNAVPTLPTGTLPESFLATFGAWQDDRSDEEIVRDIFESRTVSNAEVAL